jgi:hypothetical protein
LHFGNFFGKPHDPFLPCHPSKQYNQKYIKGREGHDWLLRKNIWRRMRYRRENKQLVIRHKESSGGPSLTQDTERNKSGNITKSTNVKVKIKRNTAAAKMDDTHAVVPRDDGDTDETTHAAAAVAAAAQEASSELQNLADEAAVEAAVAAAESFGREAAAHDAAAAVLDDVAIAAVAAAAAAAVTTEDTEDDAQLTAAAVAAAVAVDQNDMVTAV